VAAPGRSLPVACPDENTLVAFASGSLPIGDAARVEEHLDTCGICFGLVAELARTAPEDAEPTRMLVVSADPIDEDDDDHTLHAVIRPDESRATASIEPVRSGTVLPPPRAGMRRPTPIGELPRAGTRVAIDTVVAAITELAPRGETVIAAVPTGPHTVITEAIRSEPIERAAAPSSPPPTQLGRYTILHRVGAGGRGVVYAAHDRELGRRVALKLVDAGARGLEQRSARLHRDAQTLAKLAHPNLVTVFDAGRIDGQLFVATELLEGRTLEAWLGEAAWSWEQKLAIFVQAAHGLAAAHAVGLVHLDFKPANVFVDPQGRVRIVDLGLAAALGSAHEDAPTMVRGPGESLSQALVRNVTHGTAAYLAPEQLEGRGDARSDQFALCVTMFEALYGRRPFDGPESSPQPARLPPATDVPRWLGAIVLRGLAFEPERRFVSIPALLVAIDADAKRRRSLLVASLVGAGIVVVGGAAIAMSLSWSTGACDRGSESLTGVWDRARIDAIDAAVRRAAVPYAATSWPSARAGIDRWSASWVDAQRRACEATRIEHSQGDRELVLRDACLDRRLQELRGLAELWSEANAQIVEHMHDGVAELVPVAICDDPASVVAFPDDAGTRARVHAVRERIAEARALELAAIYDRALPVASEAVSAADALRDRVLQGEARLVLGAIQVAAGRVEDGARELDAAMQAAVAGGDPRLLARATSEYAQVAAQWLGQPELALQLLALGRAALERVPADRDLAADLASREGVAQRQAGRYPDAVAAFERALALRRETHRDDEPVIANALNNLANARTATGQLEQSLDEQQQALAIREAALGVDHPEVAMSLDNLGSVLASMGRLDDALLHVRRGLALRERVLGPDNPRVADSLNSLGVILTELGQIDEALASHRRALSIRERALGPEHALVAVSLNNIGFALVQLGRWDEAEATLQRAVAVGIRAHGVDHPDIAASHFNLGRAAHGRGNFEQAAHELQIALAARVRSLGERHPTVGTTWLWLARTRRDQHKRAAARDAADAALAIIDAQRDPDAWAQARLVLADVLWDEGERGKARNLVGESLATVRTAKSGQSAVAMLGAWQKARGEDEPVVVDAGQ
jgi:eukaryotic-like serine/threonine-protein kinase